MSLKKLYRKIYFFYFRYKDSPYYSMTLYTLCLIVSLILFTYVLMPQVNNLFSLQKETAATLDRIQVMNSNIAYLSSLNDAQLDNDFTVTSTALPPERDISSLLLAINTAALQSGVVLNDFSFQGGEITNLSTKNKKEDSAGAKILFSVEGSLPQTVTLLSQLQEKIPLLSISAIDAQFFGAERAQITVSYFYQAFPLITEDLSLPVKPLSTENRVLLDTLESWESPSNGFSGPMSASDASSLAPL